jgi:hypothetical protein
MTFSIVVILSVRNEPKDLIGNPVVYHLNIKKALLSEGL